MDKKELFMKYALQTPYNFNVNVARVFLEENGKDEQILKWVGKQGNSINGAVLRSMLEHLEGDGAEYPAGLYQTGSDYTVMLKSWDELLAEGVVHVDDGVLTYSNNELFIGDLAIQDDGSITAIAQNAFKVCKNLTGIKIPNSVTSIGNAAFESATSLTHAILPSNIKYIYQSMFRNCDNITSIGLVGSGADIEIPDSAIRIDGYAFYYCDGIKTVVLPNNITDIYPYAFGQCTELESIVISEGVTFIGQAAFCWCAKLSSISFNGTIEQWNAIDKGQDWKYGVIATEVVCSDGTVAL